MNFQYFGGPRDGAPRPEHFLGSSDRVEDAILSDKTESWFHRYQLVGDRMTYMGCCNHLMDIVPGVTPKRWQDAKDPCR